MNQNLCRRALVATVLFATAVPAQDSGKQEALWIQDLAVAKARAKKGNKVLLMNFTGSDWCGWCIRLDQEVFSKQAFIDEAPKNFVLVKLDYPQNKSLVTEAIRKQNKRLQEEYAIQGFPTLLLADAQGRPFAQTGYREGGEVGYLEHLAELRTKGVEFAQAIEAAEETEGADRARHLDRAMAAVGEQLAMGFYLEIVEEIMTLDAEGKLGLKAKYEVKFLASEMQETLQGLAMSGAWDKVAAQAAEYAARFEKGGDKSNQQLATFFIGAAMMESGKKKEGLKSFEKAKAILPGSDLGKHLASNIIPGVKREIEKDGGDGQ